MNAGFASVELAMAHLPEVILASAVPVAFQTIFSNTYASRSVSGRESVGPFGNVGSAYDFVGRFIAFVPAAGAAGALADSEGDGTAAEVVAGRLACGTAVGWLTGVPDSAAAEAGESATREGERAQCDASRVGPWECA